MSKALSVEELLKGTASLLPQNREERLLREVSLGDLCLAIRRGITIPSDVLMDHAADYFNDIIYIGSGSYKNHDLELWDDVFLDEWKEEWAKGEVKPGNLLLSKTITPPKAFVMDFPKDARVIADSNLFILELDEAKIDPVYLMAYLNTDEGQDKLKDKAEGAKRTKAIPIKALKEIIIPVPPIEDQRKLATRFSEKVREIARLKQQLTITEWTLGGLYRDKFIPDNSVPEHVFRIMER